MKRIKWMLLTVMLFAVTACSGGGGGSEAPASESSSNWGELVWDQDNWSDQ